METQKEVGTGAANIASTESTGTIQSSESAESTDSVANEELLKERQEVMTPAKERIFDVRNVVAESVHEERERTPVDMTKSIDRIGSIQIAFGEPPRLPIASP